MSIQAGVPIVPVSIAGTQKLMRKGEWAIRPGTATIRFGPPVDTSHYTVRTIGELSQRVHARVAAGLPTNQQPLPGTPSKTAPASP